MRALIRLYPRAWRDRYGDELLVLLEDRRPGPFDVLDLFLGALDAHLHFRNLGLRPTEGKGIPMSLRIGAGGAVLAGTLWMLAFVFGIAVGRTNLDAFFIILVPASLALLIALTGLSAFQSRRHPVLVWSSFLLPAVGIVVMVGGLLAQVAVGDRPILGELTPWAFLFVGIVLVLIGCALFGLVTWATGELARWTAGLLSLGAALLFVSLLGGDKFADGLLIVAAGAVFGLSWILLGLEAFRVDRVRVAHQPA